MYQDVFVDRGDFRFAGAHGYANDDATGWQQLGARLYVPGIGRFLTQDPLGQEGGLNLYAYCDNSPLSKVDPSGTTPWNAVSSFVQAYLPFLRNYDSEEKAAIAAGNFMFPRGVAEEREWGGWIYQRGKDFRLTLPTHSDQDDAGSVMMRNDPGNAKGFWHIHPFYRGQHIKSLQGYSAGNPLVFSTTRNINGHLSGDIYAANRVRVDYFLTSWGFTFKYDYKTQAISTLATPFGP